MKISTGWSSAQSGGIISMWVDEMKLTLVKGSSVLLTLILSDESGSSFLKLRPLSWTFRSLKVAFWDHTGGEMLVNAIYS